MVATNPIPQDSAAAMAAAQAAAAQGSDISSGQIQRLDPILAGCTECLMSKGLPDVILEQVKPILAAGIQSGQFSIVQENGQDKIQQNFHDNASPLKWEEQSALTQLKEYVPIAFTKLPSDATEKPKITAQQPLSQNLLDFVNPTYQIYLAQLDKNEEGTPNP